MDEARGWDSKRNRFRRFWLLYLLGGFSLSGKGLTSLHFSFLGYEMQVRTVLLLGAAVRTGDKVGETSHPRGVLSTNVGLIIRCLSSK